MDQAAEILVHALAHSPSAWPKSAAARSEVSLFLENPERLAFAAVTGDELLGWIGAIRHSQFVCELHPLAVGPEHQGQGLGRKLVKRLEAAARDEGICTMWLGADDDFGGTTLFGVDLYPEVLDHLRNLAPASGHPYTFYRHMGYTVVGVLPDADGPGKHDILMAKRIEARPD
ncbi:MAG: GNAT family N-acetyltransferase [Kiloniellales bacterium]|nr:GNAT family N-acetyltransferase [Kiloniellales bacterium]